MGVQIFDIHHTFNAEKNLLKFGAPCLGAFTNQTLHYHPYNFKVKFFSNSICRACITRYLPRQCSKMKKSGLLVISNESHSHTFFPCPLEKPVFGIFAFATFTHTGAEHSFGKSLNWS